MKNENTEWLDVVRGALNAKETAQSQTSPGESLWEAIQSRLDARARRTLILRRTAMAVAATTVLGLLTLAIFLPQENGAPGTPPIVENTAVEEPGIHPALLAKASAVQPHAAAPAGQTFSRTVTVKGRTNASENSSQTIEDHAQAAEESRDRSDGGTLILEGEEPPAPTEATEACPAVAKEATPERNASRQLREKLLSTREKGRRETAFRIGVGGAGMASASSSAFRSGNLSSPGGIFSDGTAAQTILYDHDMPLTAELSAGMTIGRRLYIGTGVNYTRLNSRITKKDGNRTETVHQHIDLIGIPIETNCTVVSLDRLSLYVGAGIMAQRCLSARHDRTILPAPGLLWSAEANIGVHYAFSRTVGIYAEPGAFHHFTRNGLRTIYTDRKINFSMKFGLRFSFSGI